MRAGRIRLIAALGLGLACVQGALAQDAATAARQAQTAQLADSERLRLFALGKWLDTPQPPRAAVEAMRAALVAQGYYHGGGAPALVWTDLQVAPVLGYDSNVNGGVAQDSFTSGGFLFEVDPAYRAVGAVTLGIDASAAARLAWDTGRVIMVAASARAAHAPVPDLGLSEGAVEICSRNNLTGWVFADGCLLAARSARDLGVSRFDQSSLRLSGLFQIADTLHEAEVTLMRAGNADYDQTTMTLALDTVWDRAVSGVSVTLGAPVPDRTVLDRRIAVDLRWTLAGHAVKLGAFRSTARGGRFLGADQIDRATGLRLSWEAQPGVTLALGYAHTASTAQIYDDDSFTFDLLIDGFRL